MRVQALTAAAALFSALSPGLAAPATAGAPALAGAPVVPCPATKPDPAVKRPPRPVPPALTDYQRTVGGDGLATAGLATPAGAPPPPALTATSWVVADLGTGAVLGGCGPHEYATPASVQKLLLAATFVDKLDPNQVVQINRADLDIEPGSSAVGLVEGGRYPVRTLWLGLLLNSGNDAANVLARLGGGTAAAGVAAMNAEAQRLGALQTHAVTPSGLDGKGQFTSAYDLALIARACFASAAFRTYATAERAQIPPQPAKRAGGFQIQNENQLLTRYPGALGGKTGFTDLARHTFVGAAERNGRRLVVALLGAEARPLRGWQQAAALLDWGFGLPADASVGSLVAPGEVPPTPPPAAAGKLGAAASSPDPAATASSLAGSSPAAAIGVAAAGVALLVVVLVSARWRRATIRARRAAIDELRRSRSP
ncbi:serine hydrolase [Actinomycetes bacterium KLBMP 9797]